MIKFFRRIRQNLLSEGKTGKYLKYAIGEIILVVIGILIALQINTWNNSRIDRNKEKLLMSELHEEFVNNKNQLAQVVQYHETSYLATKKLIDMFPINFNETELDSIQKYYLNVGWVYSFNPSNGVINSLINTSSFEIISNENLRRLIISWSDVLSDFREEEISAKNYVVNTWVPFCEKHLDWDGNFKDKRNNLNAFTTLEFESIIKQRNYDLYFILEGTVELQRIRSYIDQIIELTEDANVAKRDK
ncbi:DUF6090 family protein [Robiginitalea sp. IMCC44478]|uniref:DUF6090 family protein n=1 Tax=Robiginitalea sp. IMCC44478 TaxID=3459122 RepID=UPI004040FB75